MESFAAQLLSPTPKQGREQIYQEAAEKEGKDGNICKLISEI